MINYKKFENVINEEFSYYRPAERKKSFAYCVDLGEFCFIFDRPEINKDFCFDDSWDYEGAQESAEHARTSTNYFINENMKPLIKRLEHLKEIYKKTTDLKENYKVIWCDSYNGNNKIKDINILHNYGNGQFVNDWGARQTIPEDAREVKPEEIKTLIEDFKTVIEDFKKRLNTYLKKYGLSKVHSWTFWGEA